MHLRAPVAVPVEVRAPGRRVFRLALNVGEDGIALERPAPFEIGRPVELVFLLPDTSQPVRTRAELALAADDEDDGTGGRELRFIEPTEEIRSPIRRYVADRLELPTPPG